MNFEAYRPFENLSKSDQTLLELSNRTTAILIELQTHLCDASLILATDKLTQLAQIITEFAEDIYTDIGIWRTYETYNLELFGRCLPVIDAADENSARQGANRYRLQQLLWVIYQILNPGLILSPAHPDLKYLADQIAQFLERSAAQFPGESSVKNFLNSPMDFGYDVKRKLVWLGRYSYFFRLIFEAHVKDEPNHDDIQIIDDFICTQTTIWSGLGVIDILAGLLNISDRRRSELRSWYERHFAYYRILDGNHAACSVKALNGINDRVYTIQMTHEDFHLFHPDQVILGGLVPWNGSWYWSGAQHLLGRMTATDLQMLKAEFLQKMSSLVYRYHPQLLEQAKKAQEIQYQAFYEYHHSDLVSYPNGEMLALAIKSRNKRFNETLMNNPAGHISKNGATLPDTALNLPQEILNHDNGIGIYFNRREGQEIMLEFNALIQGFQKQGAPLDAAEARAIANLFYSPTISPDFVLELLTQYGENSLLTVFKLNQTQPSLLAVNYLLHCYKGHFYRNRYPSVALTAQD